MLVPCNHPHDALWQAKAGQVAFEMTTRIWIMTIWMEVAMKVKELWGMTSIDWNQTLEPNSMGSIASHLSPGRGQEKVKALWFVNMAS
jgi:hypothetical protein